nr:alanine--tRNA ligase [Lachnospiraceae bacterium]
TRVLSEEEQKFNATIDQGLSILSGLCEKLSNEKNKVLSGEDTFRLYDTFGFPVDLTEEILMEKGFSYDREGFLACMEEQRTRARAARKVSNYMGKDSTVYEKLDKALKSSFTGYDKTDDEGVVSALTNEEEVVDELKEGDKGCIVTDSTPFYGTMGGQCGDTGVIEGPDGRFNVYDTIHLSGGKIGHIGEVEEGRIKKDDRVKLLVDSGRRKLIAKNHSATHLLQAALRKVLGDHVTQAGSDVNDDRLRFDFTHFSAMSSEELKKVEDIVNEKIEEGLSVKTEVMTLSEAKKTGAMALFGEKYGESVRVVSMGDFSTELCGGTHVKDTKDIRAFSIISESGVANGVRRIEAITGSLVFDHFREMEKESRKAADLLKTSPEGLSERIEKLLKEEKELKLKIAKLEADAAKAASDSAETEEEEYNGIKAIFQKTNGLDMNALRGIGDDLKAKALSNDKAAAAVFVLFGEAEGKAFLVSMATEGAVKRGFSAGNLIKASAPMIGGGGGGRPEMAQAGGKNPAGYEDAMKKAKEYLASL